MRLVCVLVVLSMPIFSIAFAQEVDLPAPRGISCSTPVEDTWFDYQRDFLDWYAEQTSEDTVGSFVKLHRIQIHDCNPIILIDTQPKPGVFGQREVFVFDVLGWRFLGSA